MNAQKLFEDQLADAGYQLDKVLEDMTPACLDHKVTEGSMTPKEQIAHLMEAYHAFQENAAGRKYEWNTYRPASTDAVALIAEFKAKRAATVATALASDSDDKLITAHKYILGHDYYHVGQMCLARLATQPDWDPYAIYQG
jgi:hypothetical protein